MNYILFACSILCGKICNHHADIANPEFMQEYKNESEYMSGFGLVGSQFPHQLQDLQCDHAVFYWHFASNPGEESIVQLLGKEPFHIAPGTLYALLLQIGRSTFEAF